MQEHVDTPRPRSARHTPGPRQAHRATGLQAQPRRPLFLLLQRAKVHVPPLRLWQVRRHARHIRAGRALCSLALENWQYSSHIQCFEAFLKTAHISIKEIHYQYNMTPYHTRYNKTQSEHDFQEIRPIATEIQQLKVKLQQLQMKYKDIRNNQIENNKKPRNNVNVSDRAAAAVNEMLALKEELTKCKQTDENLSQEIIKDLAYYTGLYKQPPLQVHVGKIRGKIHDKYPKTTPKLPSTAHLCTMRQMLERHGRSHIGTSGG